MGSPLTEKLKIVNTYLRVDPITAPVMSARYELIKR